MTRGHSGRLLRRGAASRTGLLRPRSHEVRGRGLGAIGLLPRPAFQARMREVEAAVARLLRKARVCPDQKVAGMAEAILQLEPGLWAFVHMEQVEPTNNRSERALRPAVFMRKGRFGTHISEGSRYIERILAQFLVRQRL